MRGSEMAMVLVADLPMVTVFLSMEWIPRTVPCDSILKYFTEASSARMNDTNLGRALSLSLPFIQGFVKIQEIDPAQLDKK